MLLLHRLRILVLCKDHILAVLFANCTCHTCTYTHVCEYNKCVLLYLQNLADELGQFARVSLLEANSANLINVIQTAYDVRTISLHTL